MHIYKADTFQKSNNVLYPHCIEVNSVDDLRNAVNMDNITALMKDNRRSSDNFISCDCIHVDLDNTHSDDPDAWKTVDDIADVFDDVPFYYVRSRNHMKPKLTKGGVQAPREKDHIYFPLKKPITNVNECKVLKEKISCVFPYFDLSALDSAHFFFGIENPDCHYYDGTKFIDEYAGQKGFYELMQYGVMYYNEQGLKGNWKNINPLCDLISIDRMNTDANGNIIEGTAPVKTEAHEIDLVEQKRSFENLTKWMQKYNVQSKGTYDFSSKTHGSAFGYKIDCPWSDKHTSEGADNETLLFVGEDSKWRFMCRHDHCASRQWKDYREYIESHNAPLTEDEPEETSDLPKVISYGEVYEAGLPERSPEMIQGLLRQGHKMLISAASKSGKSFLEIELAISLCTGGKWLIWDCAEGSVFYINLEIEDASFLNRVANVCRALGVGNVPNLDIWNLRGHSIPLDELTPKIIDQARQKKYSAIIIDPLYKVITGDENSASDMAHFCNNFDKISTETGASVIYTHHHSKGAQGLKSASDRASGSGVFARDPDALLDLTEICPEDVGVTLPEEQSAYRVEGVLREFPSFKPFEIIFDYPIHRIAEGLEEADYKQGASASTKRKRGSKTASSNRAEDRIWAFNVLVNYADWNKYPNGMTANEIAEFVFPDVDDIGSKARTVRNWMKDDDGETFIQMKIPSSKAVGYYPVSLNHDFRQIAVPD